MSKSKYLKYKHKYLNLKSNLKSNVQFGGDLTTDLDIFITHMNRLEFGAFIDLFKRKITDSTIQSAYLLILYENLITEYLYGYSDFDGLNDKGNTLISILLFWISKSTPTEPPIDKGLLIGFINYLLTDLAISNPDLYQFVLVSLNKRNINKVYPLTNAIDIGNPQLIRLLIEKGANVNIDFYKFSEEYYNRPMYPLMQLIYNFIYSPIESYTDIPKEVIDNLIKLMIEYGANINYKDKYSNSITDIISNISYRTRRMPNRTNLFLMIEKYDIYMSDKEIDKLCQLFMRNVDTKKKITEIVEKRKEKVDRWERRRSWLWECTHPANVEANTLMESSRGISEFGTCGGAGAGISTDADFSTGPSVGVRANVDLDKIQYNYTESKTKPHVLISTMDELSILIRDFSESNYELFKSKLEAIKPEIRLDYLNYKNNNGNTLLHIVIENNDTKENKKKMIKYLISSGSSIDIANNDCNKPKILTIIYKIYS
jgi:ankyrin repeat protein